MVFMERALRNEINEKSLEKKYAMFLEEYGKYFTEYELWRLNGIYKMGLECVDLVDIVREIYDMFDLIKPEKNIFLGFIDLIKEHFDINANIIEVGGGIFPTLGKRIALSQHIGNVVVYDPRLYTTISNINNLKLVDKKFDNHVCIGDTNLIIGLQPYGATEEIIKTACLNRADFMIALGKAEESFGGGWYVDDIQQQTWENRIIRIAKQRLSESDMGSLEITDLSKYGSNYPVIYNKRR